MNDNEKLDLILSELQGFKQQFDKLEQRFDGLEERFDGLEQRFDKLEQRTDILEQEIKKINLTLVNVTNRNILIVAEGHFDLSRKLDECIRLSSAVKAKQQIQDIYTNMRDNMLKA